MNYERIYNEFIADRRAKESEVLGSGVYVERHHTTPRSRGGNDDAENLVALTAGDHLFAHILLGRILGGKHWITARMMLNLPVHTQTGSIRTGVKDITKERRSTYELTRKKSLIARGKITREQYANGAREKDRERIRLQSQKNLTDPKWSANLARGDDNARRKNPEKWAHVVESFKGEGNPMRNPESKRKASKNRKAWYDNPENKAKFMEAIQDPERRRKISEGQRWRTMTDEQKEHLRKLNTGKKLSEETKRKIRESAPTKKVICVETGQVYESVKSTAEHIGISSARLSTIISKQIVRQGLTYVFV